MEQRELLEVDEPVAGAAAAVPAAQHGLQKLTQSGFQGHKAILIYGFEDPKRPLAWLIEAFDLIAGQHVSLGERQAAPLLDLVHPIFCAGGVFAWEVFSTT